MKFTKIKATPARMAVVVACRQVLTEHKVGDGIPLLAMKLSFESEQRVHRICILTRTDFKWPGSNVTIPALLIETDEESFIALPNDVLIKQSQ